MKRSPVLVLLVVLLSLPVLDLPAESDTVNFVIAPPPVGYPEIEKGQKTRQFGTDVLFLTMDMMSEKMMVFGVTGFGNYQESFTDHFSANMSLGVSLLIGDHSDLTVLGFPLHMNGILELVDTKNFSLYLFGGGGGDISMSMITVQMPTASPYVMDYTTVTTTTVNSMVNAGAQMNISTKNLVISPFGSWTYSGGTYTSTQTSSMSYEYPGISGSIENYSSTVFGFDVLYKPKDISLSSQLRMTDGYTMLSVAVKWLVEGFLPKPKE